MSILHALPLAALTKPPVAVVIPDESILDTKNPLTVN